MVRSVLAALWLVGISIGLTRVAPAADAPPPPAADWRTAAAEADSGHAFFKVYANNLGSLWKDFARSQLFKSFAEDPAVSAAAAKFVTQLNERLDGYNKTVGEKDPAYVLNQFTKIGPAVTAFNVKENMRDFKPVLSAQHRCDDKFIRQVGHALAAAGGIEMADLERGDWKGMSDPYPHREMQGHLLVTTGNGTNLAFNDRHLMFYPGSLSERDLFAQLEHDGHHDSDEKAFGEFLAADDSWMAASSLNFPEMARMVQATEPGAVKEMEFAFGAISSVFAKEFVNKSNRFDVQILDRGVDLDKGIIFYGAGTPINAPVAQVFPDELIFTMHANYDFQKLAKLSDNDLAGFSADFHQSITRIQKQLTDHFVPADPGKKIKSPALTRGVTMLMLESDQLEEIGDSFVWVFGIEPGFTVTEDWVKGLPEATAWGGDEPKIKIVSYTNTDIAVMGEATHHLRAYAAVGSALVMGTNLKQVKRVVRYMVKSAAGEIDPQKSNEWQSVTNLAQQDGGGALHAFCVLKMNYIVKTLIPTGMGAAGTMLFPDMPTDVDWSAISTKLQPAVGVILFDPAKGLKGHLVSDLPLLSLGALSTCSFGVIFARSDLYRNFNQADEDDLPPLHRVDQDPDGAGPGQVPMVEGAVPQPAPAPKKEDKAPELGDN